MAKTVPAVPDTTLQFYIRCLYFNPSKGDGGEWRPLPAGIKLQLWKHNMMASDEMLVVGRTTGAAQKYVYIQTSKNEERPSLYFTLETQKKYIDYEDDSALLLDVTEDPPTPFRYFRLPETIDSRKHNDTNGDAGYLEDHAGRGKGTPAAPWTFQFSEIKISMDFVIRCRYHNPRKDANPKWPALPGGLTVKLYNYNSNGDNDLLATTTTVRDKPLYFLVKDKTEDEPDIFFCIETGKKYIDYVDNKLLDEVDDPPEPFRFFRLREEVDSREQIDTEGEPGYLDDYTGSGKGNLSTPWTFDLKKIKISLDFCIKCLYFSPLCPSPNRSVLLPANLTVKLWNYDNVFANELLAEARTVKDKPLYFLVRDKLEDEPDIFFTIECNNQYIELTKDGKEDKLIPSVTNPSDVTFIALPQLISSKDKKDTLGHDGYLDNYQGEGKGTLDEPWTFQLEEIMIFAKVLYHDPGTGVTKPMPRGILVSAWDYDLITDNERQAGSCILDEGRIYLPVFMKDESRPDIFFSIVVENGKTLYIQSDGTCSAAADNNSILELYPAWHSKDHLDYDGQEGIKDWFSGTIIGSDHSPWTFDYYCGVLSLRVKAPAAITNSHTAVHTTTDGVDDLCFAPENEAVDIEYQLANRSGGIEKATLILISTADKQKVLWWRDLEDTELGEGTHTISGWNGRVPGAEDAFPDEYVTFEHTPYRLSLKLTMVAEGETMFDHAWVFFRINIEEIDLELGPLSVLAKDQDRKLLPQLGGSFGAPGTTQKFTLSSDIYKLGAGEMTTDAYYVEYTRAHQDGPCIPVFAKLSVRKSDGTSGFSPRALGRMRLLWDWERTAPAPAAPVVYPYATAQHFVDTTSNYHSATTLPTGASCHFERGGKRGNSDRRVLDQQDGTSPGDGVPDRQFPFRVERCKNRMSAVFSYPWGSGALAGKTGVLLHPAPMAGERYTLKVFLASRSKPGAIDALDTAGAFPAAPEIARSTSDIEFWRKIHFLRHCRKNVHVTPPITAAAVQNHFVPAFMEVDFSGVLTDQMDGPTYNATVAGYFAQKDWWAGLTVDPAVDQQATSDNAVNYRTWGDWKTQVTSHPNSLGWTNLQLNAWSQGISDSKGGVDPFNNPITYFQLLVDWSNEIIGLISEKYFTAKDGVHIFHFGLPTNHPAPGGYYGGMAAQFASSTRNRCGIWLCCNGPGFGGGGDTMDQLVAHEIGHQLFLPHSISVNPTHDPVGSHDISVEATAGGQQAQEICIMSYNKHTARGYCGLCLLRLRGWSKMQTDQSGEMGSTRTIHTNPALNSKP